MGKLGTRFEISLTLKGQDMSVKPQASGSNKAPKKNHFYALISRGEQKNSPDVVTSTLNVFSINVYALLDPRDTLSFITFL